MWTDEQLAEQGWSKEQISQYRIQQDIAESPKKNVIPEQATESQFTGSGNSDSLTTVTASNNLHSEGSADSKLASTPSMFQDKTQTILIVCMMVIAPLSLYGVFTGGPEGPAGVSGEQGENGTAGSSFHLVQTSADLPTCDESVNEQIFFVANDNGFEVCQNQAWSIINLTGLQGDPGLDGSDGLNGTDGVNGTDGTNGINGQNGADGNDGANGQDGTNGSNGADGDNGLTSLIVSSLEPNGVNCPTGGTRIDTGIDDNGNSFLEGGEIDDTIFVCNGEDGNDGADGADGANGSSTTTMMVARLSVAPAYLGCNGTGQLLQQGLDDGSGNGIAQNGILESGEIITSSLICTTFSVDQVEDINSGASGSLPSNFCTINSTLFFTANNGTTNGIWSMDVDGNISSEYTGTALGMRVIGNQLMFLGQTPNLDTEPFVYDPSNGTAWQIADIFPGNSGSFAAGFTLIGTTVYFSARDSAGSTGIGLYDLWAYDTVNFSVWKVEPDIQPTSLVTINSDLYFSAGPNNGNVELWKHDTATNTTFMVKDINPGTLSSSPSHLTVMGTTIYMSANAGTTYGTELYAYDTTNNSTWLAADIRPGFAGSAPSELVILGTRVYLQATSGSHFEMWAYESNNNSFWEVTNIQSTSSLGGPNELTVRGNTVFFSAGDGTTGEELWAHSSINRTTWQVIDLKPIGGYVGEIYVHDGNLYFAGEDNWTGIELWKLIFSRQVTFV